MDLFSVALELPLHWLYIRTPRFPDCGGLTSKIHVAGVYLPVLPSNYNSYGSVALFNTCICCAEIAELPISCNGNSLADSA